MQLCFYLPTFAHWGVTELQDYGFRLTIISFLSSIITDYGMDDDFLDDHCVCRIRGDPMINTYDGDVSLYLQMICLNFPNMFTEVVWVKMVIGQNHPIGLNVGNLSLVHW